MATVITAYIFINIITRGPNSLYISKRSPTNQLCMLGYADLCLFEQDWSQIANVSVDIVMPVSGALARAYCMPVSSSFL
jgi:hypothetical protein